MNKTLSVLIALLFCAIPLAAQERKTVTVKAGSSIEDSFTRDELYRYPEFIQGKISFKNGTSTVTRLNYSMLAGEMLFIASGDTLAIANKKDIRYVQIMLDTFYYDNGYLEVLAGAAPTLMTRKQYIKISDIKKEGPIGTRSSTSSVQTYSGLSDRGTPSRHDMILQEDLVLSKNTDYYFGNPERGFMLYKKNNVLKQFSEQKNAVSDFLKKNAIDFRSQEDLLRLTAFLQQFNP